MDVATHEWSGSWRVSEEEDSPHIAKVNIHHAFAFKAFGLKLFKMDVEAHQVVKHFNYKYSFEFIYLSYAKTKRNILILNVKYKIDQIAPSEFRL